MAETHAEIKVESVPQQPDGPLSAGQAIPTMTMVLVAMIGGALSFYKKWKEGNVRAFNITEFIGEVAISGLCGIVCYWALKGFGVNEWLIAASVGVVGHMGSRALFLAEKTIETFADKWASR